MTRPSIPCNRPVAHGESCSEGRLCSRCEYILYLEDQLKKKDAFEKWCAKVEHLEET